MLTMGFKSFERVIVNNCSSKGSKATSYQSLRSEKKSATRCAGPLRTISMWPRFESQTMTLSSKFDRLQLYSPFDLQRPTVPLKKDLNSVGNILTNEDSGNIFKINFALSK